MKIKYFILILLASMLCFSQEELVYREYKENGDLDALIDNYNEIINLVQLDVINDSLYNLALAALPDLQLYGGPASYHRLMSEDHLIRLSENLTTDYYKIIKENYSNPESRIYWTETLQGNQYNSTSGETSNSCMCLSSSDCVVVGYNDSWYNPFDYYGEVAWSFIPPPNDEIVEARVYIAGSQCDDLPVWSETYMSVKNNSCNWSDFQATLSIDNTINGPYIIPDELLNDIWCSGSLQPVIGSEDNYNVDWVQIELYYSCDSPESPSYLEASDQLFCDYVQLDWLEDSEVLEFNLYRDGELISPFSNNQTQYIDYFATEGQSHEYCLSSIDGCGESEYFCNIGSRKPAPDSSESVMASENYIDFISISWLNTDNTEYYNLYRDGFLLSVLAQDMLEYTDIYVESDTIYEYCIESFNNCGGSNWNCDYGSLSIGEIGDINLDQVIDILDIVIIINFVLELEIPTEEQLWLADGNSDGVVNVLDVVMLVNMILSD